MQLLFLNSNEPLSKRDAELREATARSHAAKIAHQRAKRRVKIEQRSSQDNWTANRQSLLEPFESYDFSTLENVPKTSIKQQTINESTTQPTAETITLLRPQSVLIRGQSDPFDTLPVRVDAKTHELLMYFRRHLLFPRHRVTAKTWKLSQGATSDWQDARRSLEDHGLGNAFLAQTSASIALENPSSSTQLVELSLLHVRQSTVTLRSRLERNQDNWDHPRVWRHIALLQNAELLIRNAEATMVHGKILRRLFDQLLAYGIKIQERQLLLALYVDVHMAITFLVRPNFKPSPTLLAQFPDINSDLLRDVSAVFNSSMRHLDYQIVGENLRNIFLRWEQCRIITSFYGRRLWTFLAQLTAVDHLLDIEEELSRSLDSSGRNFLHTQAYVCLAALYWIRVTTIPEHFEEPGPYTAHSILLKRLRYHLEFSSNVMADEHLYHRARLWALFVGAHSEHQAALLHHSHPASVSKSWFNTQFAQQAECCGLRDWTSVREVLESFMYCKVTPDPSEWYSESRFWQMMGDVS